MTTCTLNAQEKTALTSMITTIPGDKSISHRAIMIGALAENTSHFTNFLFSEDCLNTLAIFQALGVNITVSTQEKSVVIKGVGLHGLTAPAKTLEVGNSGTSIRLLSGILSGQKFTSTITGDTSIKHRPMKRVAGPLAQMGAVITGTSREGRQDIFPPLTISKAPTGLQPITYTLPVASAQVKSCIIFASLYSDQRSTIIEPETCRDHTERLLRHYGADIELNGPQIHVSGKHPLRCPDDVFYIPGDISSAAFFIVLGLIMKNSELTLTGIGLNPTRNRLISVLQKMGADIEVFDIKNQDGEPYGTLRVRSSVLTNGPVDPADVPIIIDEIPILAITALFGNGTFQVRDAQELRVKESDRIQSICHMINAMGGSITEYDDGFDLKGPAVLQPFEIDSHHDHRIAMSAIIGSIGGHVAATVHNCACINTSFPNFFDILTHLGVQYDLSHD